MKRFTILALITIGTILPANAILVSVWCTPNRKMCKIGKYTLKTTTEEPLYIKENLVCTPDKKMCSDGTKSVRSSKPLF